MSSWVGGQSQGIWGGGADSAPRRVKPKEPAWYEKGIAAAGGILGGLVDTGYHAVKDPLAEIATGGRYESTIDDIAMAIVDDYKKRYSSWEDFTSDPVAGVLDMLTVAASAFTFGGAAAVRGAALAGKGGKAAKFAGLAEDAELTALNRAAAGGSEDARRAYTAAESSRELEIASTLGRKGPIDRAISGQSGRVVTLPDGTVLSPARAQLKGIDGSVLDTIPLASSPYRRLLQNSGARISSKLPDAPVIGTNARVGKKNKRIDRIIGENQVTATLGMGGAHAVRKAGEAMTEKEQIALLARNTIGEAEEGPKALGKFFGDNANTLERRAADGSVDTVDDFASAADDILAVAERERGLDSKRAHQRGEYHDKYLAEVAKAKREELSLKGRANATQMATLTKQLENVDRRLADGGVRELNSADEFAMSPFAVRPTSRVSQEAGPIDGSPRNVTVSRAKVARTNTLNRRRSEIVKQMAAISARQEKLRGKMRSYDRVARTLDTQGMTGLRAALGNMKDEVRAVKSGEVAQIINDLRMRQTLLNLDQVDALFRAPSQLMLRVEEAQKSASKYTTEFLKGDLNINVRDEMADGTLLARMVLGRELTPEEAAAIVVRPHSRAQAKTANARELRGKYDKKPTGPKSEPSSSPVFSKYSRGYNFKYAQDSMSPAAVFKVWNESRAYQAKTRLMGRVAQSGIRIDADAAQRMGYRDVNDMRESMRRHPDYELVGGKSDMLRKADKLRDRLDNEVKLMVGDSVAHEQASTLIRELLEKHVDEAAEYAMPKEYYKHLAKELTRANNFVTRMLDAPTAVFRAAVLNLRPAWMVSNFVGQMMLLMLSQGVLHGAREYGKEVIAAVKSGRIGGRTAGRDWELKAGGADPARRALADKAGALSMGEGTQAREMAEAGIAASNATGLKWLVDWPGFRRVKDQAGKPEGSLAAHTIALALKGVPSGAKGMSNIMGRINQVVTDDIPRRAAFMGEVRPILKRAAKRHPELSDEELLRLVLNDDEIVARLVDKTMGDLIDFSRMNQFEREGMRRLLPFYGWMKGITLRTGRLVKDDPLKANGLYNVGANYSGDAKARFGGLVPDNLKGAIKLGENEDGPVVLTTAGMNIFQTPADIAGMVGNLLGKGEMKLGSSHPFSQFNPAIKAPLEVAIGRDLFFGGPLYSDPSKGLRNTGVLDRPWTPEDESASKPYAAMQRYLSALGPIGLYERYKKAGPYGAEEQRLLARSKAQTWGQYLAAPTATLNLDKAEDMATGGVQYGLVGYDPTKGETPGVFGRQQQSTGPAQTGFFS